MDRCACGREFERSQVTMALALWKLKVAAHHFEQDSRRYRHIAGRDKFATVLRRLNRRRKAMALEKLIYVRIHSTELHIYPT